MQCRKNLKIKEHPNVTTAHFYGVAWLDSEGMKHQLSLKLHSKVIPNLNNAIHNVSIGVMRITDYSPSYLISYIQYIVSS